MEISKEQVFRDMMIEVAERYKHTFPGINRIWNETAYLLRMAETGKEKCDALIENPWHYLVQYKNEESFIPDCELSSISICIAFKILIWSETHPDRLLSFLAQGGGGESCKLLPYIPLSLVEKLVGAWLDAGLSYEKHQGLFDGLLSENQTCRELIFPRARYPSARVNMSRASLRMLLQQAKSGRSYEKNIPILVDEISERLKEGIPGIFPYYSRKRTKESCGELLAVLIIRDSEAYFYIKNQDTYYEINRTRLAEKERS